MTPETGNAIFKLRMRLSLTQEQFAYRLGVTVSTVSRWECGHRAPSPLAAKALAYLDRNGKFLDD